MVKKLKALAGGAAEGQLAQTVRDSAQQIWLAGLGAFAKAQAEGMKAFNTLVKQGESIHSQTRKAAGDRVAEMADKATGTWDKLEQVFEDRVARSLSRLGVPTKKDIETLSRRVAELTDAVQELNGGSSKPARPATPAKPAKAAKPARPARPVARRSSAK
jgi:poly(hydroxyalkanoate) granule-associated protein